MDEPGGPQAIQRQIERDFGFNFVVNVLDGACWSFGMSFISFTIILPLYVSHFTTNPILIGLIPFLASGGYLVPMLFTANAVERAPRKKFFPVNVGFFVERLPIFLLAPSAFFLALRQPQLALGSFFILLACHTIGAGAISVGWQDMVAKIFPVQRRGRALGVANFMGSATGILGAFIVPVLLQRYAFPNGFVLAFLAASFLIFLSWIALSLTREPAVPSTQPRRSQLDYLRSLPAVLRADHNFRLYLLTQVVSALSGMANGFLVVFTIRKWGLPDAYASGFSIALQVGLALTYLFFGPLADRRGHKLTMEICLILNVFSFALAVAAPGPAWFFVIFFLRGMVTAIAFVSGISIVYEFTGAENRPTYIGLANTLPGLVGAVAPLLGGWLAGALGYPPLFLTATLIGAVAWALLRFGVREPRASSPAVAGDANS